MANSTLEASNEAINSCAIQKELWQYVHVGHPMALAEPGINGWFFTVGSLSICL